MRSESRCIRIKSVTKTFYYTIDDTPFIAATYLSIRFYECGHHRMSSEFFMHPFTRYEMSIVVCSICIRSLIVYVHFCRKWFIHFINSDCTNILNKSIRHAVCVGEMALSVHCPLGCKRTIQENALQSVLHRSHIS